MSEYKYQLRYLLESEKNPDDWSEEDKEKYYGLTDSFIFIKIVEPKDANGEGPYGMLMESRDGFTDGDRLTGPQLFKAWSLMAKDILDNYKPLEWQKTVLETSFEMVRAVIMAGR